MRSPAPGFVVFFLFMLASLSANRIGAGGERIEPGPTTISPAEAAIAADPAAGLEQAVILVAETMRNDDLQMDSETRFHLRAKILSGEGRELANVELPWLTGDRRLKEWWGRTLLPDGRVLELKQTELERQLVARTRGVGVETIRAALPGVVPGSVIDYGWVTRGSTLGTFDTYERVMLQRQWPIRLLRYSWKPSHFFQGAYRLFRTDDLDVREEIAKQAILITGRNLPPVVDEPWMPPEHAVRGSVILYYVVPFRDFEGFWSDTADFYEGGIRAQAGVKKLVAEAMESMGLTAEGSRDERLRAAYDWINTHITRTDVRSFEEAEQSGPDAEHPRNLIRDLLARREGSALDVQTLFVGVARALGGDAHLVLVGDRTQRLFDPNLRSLEQIDATLVAIGSGDAPLLADPGSGLPFGEIPWWYAGTVGLVLEGKRAREIQLPTSGAASNVAARVAEVSFDEDGTILARWSETGRGQVGLTERRILRRLAPEDRESMLRALCGVGDQAEVLRAEIPELHDLSAEFRLDCEVEIEGDHLEEIGAYHFALDGPWIRPLPDLPAGKRIHPVVFEFPRTDTVELSLRAPDGFTPFGPPQPVEVESAYGRYELRIEPRDTGFHVQRTLVLHPTWVDPPQYDDLRSFLEQVRRFDRLRVEFARRGAS